MVAAIEAVKDGTMSINKSALLHGVPPTTLKDRLSGRVKQGAKPGSRPYLNNQEERALADHLIKAAKIGYDKTRKEVKSIVERVAEEKHCLRGTQVTDGWWTKFLQRQPQLSLDMVMLQPISVWILPIEKQSSSILTF